MARRRQAAGVRFRARRRPEHGPVWCWELDAGSCLCPAYSMYRIARAAGQSRERRRQVTHLAKVKSVRLADPLADMDLGHHPTPVS
jgi:hypothetical protein